MIVVVVTFRISSELDAADLKEKFLETAPLYRDAKGLIRKNYIADMENQQLVESIVLIPWRMPRTGLMMNE